MAGRVRSVRICSQRQPAQQHRASLRHRLTVTFNRGVVLVIKGGTSHVVLESLDNTNNSLFTTSTAQVLVSNPWMRKTRNTRLILSDTGINEVYAPDHTGGLSNAHSDDVRHYPGNLKASHSIEFRPPLFKKKVRNGPQEAIATLHKARTNPIFLFDK